MGQFEAKF